MIKAQRTTKDNVTPYIVVNNTKLQDENMLTGWPDNFEDLASPKNDPHYDSEYEKSTNLVWNCCHRSSEYSRLKLPLPARGTSLKQYPP